MRAVIERLWTLIQEEPPRPGRRFIVATVLLAVLLIGLEGALVALDIAGGRPASEIGWSYVAVTGQLAVALLLVTVSVPVMVFSSLIVGASAAMTGSALLPLLTVPFITAAAFLYLRRRSILVFLIGQALIQAVTLLFFPEAGVSVVIALLGLLAGAYLGLAFRRQDAETRRAASERAEEWERHDRMVAEVRRSIARDLHDLVAHHLAVLALQAEALNHVRDEAERTQMVSTLGAVARQAHAELRGLLDVLYISTDDGNRSAGPEAIDGLELRSVGDIVVGIESAREALEKSGRPTQVHSSVHDQAQVPGSALVGLHRILIESTANVLKHAPRGARCEIFLTVTDHHLALQVVNDLDGAPHEGSASPRGDGAWPTTRGYGLLNIRERTHLVGGSAHAGVRDGRWSVDVEIPLTR